MKILQVSNFFKPSWETGGVTKVNYELSKNLVKQGHEVTVYTTDGYSSRLEVPTNKPVNVDGIRVYYFYNLFRILVTKMKFPTPYYLPFVLRKEIQKYDLIHIHEHRTLLAAFIHYYARKNNIPYVLQSHGSVLPFLQKQKFKQIFDRFVGYDILKNATATIALNESEVSQYEKMGVHKKNVIIIPNGISLDDFNNPPSKGTFKQKYSINADEKIILYVGRIHQSKGLELLVNSFSLLLKKEKGIKLVLLGPDNGFRNELEALIDELGIKENVVFTGFVDKEEKMAALNDADVFVTPSFTGFPVTFLEACIFELPIVTTKKGDLLDWIHNKIGYVVEYNVSTFCDGISSILNDNYLSEYFGKEGKKMVETNFSMNCTISKVESLYTELVLNNK